MGSVNDTADACVKSWIDLGAIDAGANIVSIAAIGADGFDNVYTLAVNEQTRFSGFLKVYVTTAADGLQVRRHAWSAGSSVHLRSLST